MSLGYNTAFYGLIAVEPPLDAEQVKAINDWNQERHDSPDNPNKPPEHCPGLNCDWIAEEDGTSLRWDGNEKTYDHAEWLVYLIGRFLKPGQLCNGEVDAVGEDSADLWQIKVVDNTVYVLAGDVTYSNPVEMRPPNGLTPISYGPVVPDDPTAPIDGGQL